MDEQRDIFIACSVGDLEWLGRSILGCAKPIEELVNHEGLTPFHVSAKYGNVAVLEYLLNKCPDVNVDVITFDLGETLLHSCMHSTAPMCTILECVKTLLNRGANCNKTNKFNQTPLHIAAENGLAQVVKLLLSNGADDSVKDAKNHTPLDLAKLNGHYECARLLQALLWARQKDSATDAQLHVQRAMKEQLRVQRALQKTVRQKENQVAYRNWLEDKQLTGIKPPQQCKQRKKDRLLISDNKTCYGCLPVKESKSETQNTTGHHGTEKSSLVSKIEISLNQAEHNTLAVGKPDKLYPYSNYPPRKQQATQHQHTTTLSRPSSSYSQRHRQSRKTRSSSRMSSKSLPTPRLGGSTPTPATTVAQTPSLHMPPSYVDYSIHGSSANNIHDHRSLSCQKNSCQGNSIATEHGGVRELNEDKEELEESGSTSSIDGLTFHEVGPENNLQTLISSGEPGSNAVTTTLTPMELIELFRENASPKLHRRHSIGAHPGSHRHKYQRAISLSAIPEGEIVMRYDEQQQENGSRVFDEKFLLSLMPYAFEKAPENEDDHSKEMELEADEFHTDDISNDPPITKPILKTHSSNGSSKNDTVKVVNVAWDDESNEVKTLMLEEKRLSPRSSSPIVSTSFNNQSDTSLSRSISFKESEGSAIRVKPNRNNRRILYPGNMSTAQSGTRNVLRTTLYKFGGDLVYIY